MGLISGFSDIRLSLKWFILDGVKSLMYGLFFIDWVLMSKNAKLGKWSAMSVIRFPDEHLFYKSFLGVLIKMWSIRVAWVMCNAGR